MVNMLHFLLVVGEEMTILFIKFEQGFFFVDGGFPLFKHLRVIFLHDDFWKHLNASHISGCFCDV